MRGVECGGGGGSPHPSPERPRFGEPSAKVTAGSRADSLARCAECGAARFFFFFSLPFSSFSFLFIYLFIIFYYFFFFNEKLWVSPLFPSPGPGGGGAAEVPDAGPELGLWRNVAAAIT